MRLRSTLFVVTLLAAAPAWALASPQDAPPAPAAPEAAAAAPAAPADLADLEGEWAGALDVGAVKLRLVLRVEAAGDGGLAAVLDSVDQGAKMPVDSVTLDGRTVRLSIASIGGSFEGTLAAGGESIEGRWSQGGRSLPLTFARTDEPFVLERPQTPRAPFPYQSRDVTFENAGDGVRLAGTLLVPAGEGPFPAVLFVTGSGAQDRDETLLGHQPFWVIADHLARHGIASLRYDDRGYGESQGDHAGSTVADFAADAAAGIALLAAQPNVDPGAIGIVGHSEGGLTGPRAAATNEEVDFLVLLAPPGVPMTALLQRQTRDVLRLQGVDEAMIEAVVEAQAADLELLQDESIPIDRLRDELRARSKRRREAIGDAEAASMGWTDEAVEQGISVATTPWFRSLVREDPAVHLRALDVPVLALFGEKDIQVAAEENAAAVRAALAAGEASGEPSDGAERPRHEVRVLPGLNHLFQHAGTGAVAEYGEIEETFAPEALDAITGWIGAQFPSRGDGR